MYAVVDIDRRDQREAGQSMLSRGNLMDLRRINAAVFGAVTTTSSCGGLLKKHKTLASTDFNSHFFFKSRASNRV